MIFVDANIFMYAAGSPHPHKAESLALLDRIARGEVDALIDAEILQELLHRYRFIGRWKDGRQVYLMTRRIIPTIVAVTADVVDEAWILLDKYPRLMARDALHAAVCRSQEVEALCSYDADFDLLTAIRRVEPKDLL
jgi:uncharacterized protein